MTVTRAATFCLVLLAGSAAHAQVPGPLCGRPEVLAQVRDTLRRAGRDVALDPAAGQRPTGQPGLVGCAVRVHTLVFDTSRFGPQAQDQVSVLAYTLELRRNGVFLRPF